MNDDLYQHLFELACAADLGRVFEQALDLVVRASGAERGFLVTVGPRKKLDVRCARNLDGGSVGGQAMKPSRTVVREALRRGAPVRVSLATDSAYADHESISESGLQAILAVPVLESGRVVAVVCVDSTQREAFTQGVEERVAALSTPLGAVVKRAQGVDALQRKSAALEARIADGRGPAILGQSAALAHALDSLLRVATTDVPVLLHGETGTGKELMARKLHAESSRHDGPLVTVNCAALPAELIESELFGHTAGAFTGATRTREGRFATANGGTLFLDEIGELSPAAQTRFLRALETGEIQRVGDDRARTVDVRVVAATHRDLRDPALGFRADLYYRLAVVTIPLPALRERRADVPILSEAFCLEQAHAMNKAVEGISDDAHRVLAAHDWPGNVRELRNAIQRAVIFARKPLISVLDLPPEVGGGSQIGRVIEEGPFLLTPPKTLEELQDAKRAAGLELERAFAGALLEAVGGNVTQAAKNANLSRPAFYDLLQRTGLDPKTYR